MFKKLFFRNSFSSLLFSTGDKPIVEESRKDNFWGAKIDDDKTLIGVNALGRLLMELRAELRGPNKQQLKRVQPPCFSEFLIYGHRIDLVEEIDLDPVQDAQRPLFEIS